MKKSDFQKLKERTRNIHKNEDDEEEEKIMIKAAAEEREKIIEGCFSAAVVQTEPFSHQPSTCHFFSLSLALSFFPIHSVKCMLDIAKGM